MNIIVRFFEYVSNQNIITTINQKMNKINSIKKGNLRWLGTQTISALPMFIFPNSIEIPNSRERVLSNKNAKPKPPRTYMKNSIILHD